MKHARELEAQKAEAARLVAEAHAVVEKAQREMEGAQQETVRQTALSLG